MATHTDQYVHYAGGKDHEQTKEKQTEIVTSVLCVHVSKKREEGRVTAIPKRGGARLKKGCDCEAMRGCRSSVQLVGQGGENGWVSVSPDPFETGF